MKTENSQNAGSCPAPYRSMPNTQGGNIAPEGGSGFRILTEPLRQTLAHILDVLAPRHCPGCDETGVSTPMCSSCHERLQVYCAARLSEARVGGVSVVSLGPFEPPLSDAIKRLKYLGRTDLAAPLAQLYWQHRSTTCLKAFGQGAVLIPVPLHPLRLLARGYNQSALFARALGRLAGYRCEPLRLRRIQMTQAQATLDRRARLVNLQNAFRNVSGKRQPSKRNIVLVDDVVTTGATVLSCLQAATKAGQHVAGVIALAHTKALSDLP
jgi:ComF family protein